MCIVGREIVAFEPQAVDVCFTLDGLLVGLRLANAIPSLVAGRFNNSACVHSLFLKRHYDGNPLTGYATLNSPKICS
jgi:hypothetical protein